MKALLLDKRTNTIQAVEINPNNKDEITKHLCCDYFDAPLHKIGWKMYRVLADDDGWPRDGETGSDRRVSAITTFYIPLIYGNLLFLKQDGEELVGVTDDDMDNIAKHTVKDPKYGLVVVI